MPQPIDRIEVQRLTDEGAQVVDVLPKKKYSDFHLPRARSFNQDNAGQLQGEKPVIVLDC
jgi:hypothetical protein